MLNIAPARVIPMPPTDTRGQRALLRRHDNLVSVIGHQRVSDQVDRVDFKVLSEQGHAVAGTRIDELGKGGTAFRLHERDIKTPDVIPQGV